MMPDWLDYERLQILLAAVIVLAVVLALVFLALLRRPARKVFAVVAFGAIALGAAWQLHATAEARRTDCARVEFLGSRVVVPACPEPRA
ncbi:MAG: hypothetical protein ACXW2C_01250 [Acidimicrobiia bacterium]